MALFDQYTKPGVYTRESVADPGTILFGDLRIPVFIGEGNEEFVTKNQTMHRGSSSVADDLVVKENLSSQLYDGSGNALAPMRQFLLTYFPVVKGDGTGTTTNTPSDITILADGAPVVITALNGVTGVFQTQSLIVAGTSLTATYYFKRKDTQFTDDVSGQVPAYATWTTQPNMVLTLSNPGALGKNVTLALTKGTPATDALAVSGIGTDAISIELQQLPRNIAVGLGLTFTTGTNSVLRSTGLWADEGVKIGDKIAFTGLPTTANNVSTTVLTVSGATITVAATLTTAAIDTNGTTTLTPSRTLNDLSNLILSGIATASGGNLVVTSITSGHGTDGATAVGTTSFVNGAGPSSNTTFEVTHLPIVDGTNGGIVTSSATNVSATVNGVAAAVQAVDGPNGLITLVNPVAYGSTVTLTYYSNNYQDTYDILPASNVTSLTSVGFGPDRSDFIDGSDFTLTTLANGSNAIQWGSAVTDQTGQFTAGFTAFDPTHVVPTLVDEKMFLQPVQGVVNGKNNTFTLLDVPVDGSGRGTATNDPSLVSVYVGATPSAALAAGAVRVIQVIGSSKTIKLYNPPVSGTVYASYYRNSLNDHTYTLSVVAAGVTGQGTYTISDENSNVLPPISIGSHAVNEAAFSTTGIVWPKSNGLSLPDLNTVAGSSPDETITVTFQDDGLQFPVTLAAQASVLGTTGNNLGLLFTALTPGTAMNGKTVQLVSGGTGKTDATATVVVGNNLTIEIVKADNTTTRTLAEIIALLSTYHASTITPAGTGSEIFASLAVGSGISASSQVVVMASPAALAGGVNLVQTPYALKYKVTSSKVSGNRTGGVTTPSYPNYVTGGIPVGTDGFLNQTFVDATTGVKFTLVNPADALSYSYTSLPSPSYHYRPGDTLTFIVNKATARYTSSTPVIAIPGLKVKVVSTYGMRDSNGGLVNPDTNIITTYNKSGNEPSIGDYYYVTFTVAKTDLDLALKLYSNPADAYAQYGDPTPSNKLSLAARLFTQNGGQIFGCIQVRKDTGLETASDASFMTAISSLAAPLPGSNRKADMIQPLSTSPVVVQYLNRHLLTQSSQRNSGEATSVFGFDFYATPDSMRNSARSIKSDRLTGMAVPGAILQLDINGKSAEYAVGGEMVAAAMAGAIINPAIDVATTLTRQNLVGFSRLTKRYDDPTLDLMAADGLTCLTENGGAFQIRHWVTTDSSSVLKREPTSRLIVDYTRRQVRKNLDQFIGRKLLQTALNSISIVTSSTLGTLVSNEIIEGYKNLVVTKDAADPTVVHVAFALKPLFSLLWIDVSLTVSTSL